MKQSERPHVEQRCEVVSAYLLRFARKNGPRKLRFWIQKRVVFKRGFGHNPALGSFFGMALLTTLFWQPYILLIITISYK